MNLWIFISLCVFCMCPSHALDDLLEKGTTLYKIVKKLTTMNIAAATAQDMVNIMNSGMPEVSRLLHQMRRELRDLVTIPGVNSTFALIKPLVEVLPPGARIDYWVQYLEAEMKQIDAAFQEFWIISLESHDAEFWKTFALYHPGLELKMETIRQRVFAHSSIVLNQRQETLALIIKTSALETASCREAAPMQLFLAHLFEALLIAEVRTLPMITYTTMVQEFGANAWKQILNSKAEDFRQRLERYVQTFSLYMDSAPQDVLPCDPPDNQRLRGRTYFEMEQLEQAVIRHIKPSLGSRNCSLAKQYGLLEAYSSADSCSGALSDCQYHFKQLEVCQGRYPKRYEWIVWDKGIYSRNGGRCNDGVSSYGGQDMDIDHCICSCYQPASNLVSLTPIAANVSNNMVITGLRFVRKDQVLYLQAKQGKLLPNGRIDQDSQSWIDLPERGDVALLTLTNNKFYLGDAKLMSDYAAVGVRFNEDNGFSIAVTGQKFNYSTGKLLQETYSVVAKDKAYRQLMVPKKNSAYVNLTHKVDSHNNWVKLQVSELSHDVGQSTLPLFDGVAVEGNVPIRGIGMVHKGAENYAGFISLRLFTLDYREMFTRFIDRNVGGRAFAGPPKPYSW